MALVRVTAPAFPGHPASTWPMSRNGRCSGQTRPAFAGRCPV